MDNYLVRNDQSHNPNKNFDGLVRKPYLIELVENMKEQFQVISAFSPSELPSVQSEMVHYEKTE